MAIFKCKMCGGDLEINEGVTIAECEYCGTKQTVPKVMDENLQNLFNRANTLRIKSEFDKAEKLYEKIIQADTTQSEAYWGLILCKYGIEYVDDPATYKKVPTCHRASYDSIIADDDYKAAIANADAGQRALYEEQAKEIDRIQKEILALAQNEEKYDVFICYKETDANGHRTQDSAIANDIYYQLTQEGFKVFYAAITLEGKLGSAYEPIIFAALNSAKVMLAIGTKPEYFNAVWVKNEWSRFLKIIKKDRSKLLILCYRNMDAYELPEEFAHLQAQDMSKIGFINDVVRGIQKVIKKDEPKTTVVKETVVTNTATNVEPLLKRAFMFLEDGEWNSADEYAEKVLDIDPENAKAYLVKLMAELRIRKMKDLGDGDEPYNHNPLYEKAFRFGDEELRKMLDDYDSSVYYNDACGTMKKAETAELYNVAAEKFKALSGYKDADLKANECFKASKAIEEDNEAARKDEILRRAKNLMEHDTAYMYREAIRYLESIRGWKQADEQLNACHKKIKEIEAREAFTQKLIKKIAIIGTPFVIAIIAFVILLNNVIIPNREYNEAIALMDAGKYTEAISAFEALDGYKDSTNKISECNIAILDGKYNDAIALMDAGKYTEAISAFEALHGHKDSVSKVLKCNIAIRDGKYNDAIALMEAGKYTEAIIAFEALNGHKDSKLKITECKKAQYNNAIALMDAGKYTEAISVFKALDGYGDSLSKIEACKFIIENGRAAYDKWGVLQIGDEITIGKYEQDNDISNGKEKIEWIVLDVKDGKALVVSKYVLEAKTYHNSLQKVTWETSALRKWLNNDFINAAFSAYEIAMIPTVTVAPDKNPEYDTNPGDATQDQLFLLSIKEIETYSRNYRKLLKCDPTDYAVANGVDGTYKEWWLRSPGQTDEWAATVFLGSISEVGESVYYDYITPDVILGGKRGVRPAMWIDLDSAD